MLRVTAVKLALFIRLCCLKSKHSSLFRAYSDSREGSMKFGGPRMVELVLRDSNMQDISCIKKGEGG